MIAGRYDFVIALSDRAAHELVDGIGIQAAKVTVIKSGVPERLMTVQREQHEIRR